MESIHAGLPHKSPCFCLPSLVCFFLAWRPWVSPRLFLAPFLARFIASSQFCSFPLLLCVVLCACLPLEHFLVPSLLVPSFDRAFHSAFHSIAPLSFSFPLSLRFPPLSIFVLCAPSLYVPLSSSSLSLYLSFFPRLFPLLVSMQTSTE